MASKIGVLAGSLGLAVLTACGNGGDDPTATSAGAPSPTSVAASPTTSQELVPTETAMPQTTATAAGTPTAATTPTLEPTPSAPALPTGGAPLTVADSSVTRVVSAGQTLYAVGRSQLLRSDDGGVSWQVTGAAPEGTVVVAVDDSNTLFAGGRASCGRGFSEIPFVRSFDGGETSETLAESQGHLPLLTLRSGSQLILLGTDCGLDISFDDGQSWQAVPDLNGEDVFAAASEQTPTAGRVAVVAVTEGGTGRLFIVDLTNPAEPNVAGAVAQFYANAGVDWEQGRLVVATSVGVGVSDDTGQTWSWSRAGLEAATYSADPLTEGISTAEQSEFFNFPIVEVDPADTDRIWVAGSHGAYLSQDGGQTWTLVGDDQPVNSLVVAESVGRVFVATNAGTRIWSLDGS
jgi:hypothetical protein